MRYRNERRSRTPIFSVNGAQKILIEHKTTSKNQPVFDKKVSSETLSEEFKPVGLENYDF